MLVGAVADRPCCAACADHGSASSAAGVSALALRDPHAIRMAGIVAGGQPQTMGRFGVFQGDVDALKRSINPGMIATNGALKTCSQATASEHAAWEEFFAAWQAFHDEPTPLIVGVGRRYDEAIAYREQLTAWQEQFRTKCSIPGPSAGASTETDASNVASAVRWGAVAVIAVAVVYGVHTVAKL